MNYYFDSDNDSDTLSTFLNEFEVLSSFTAIPHSSERLKQCQTGFTIP